MEREHDNLRAALDRADPLTGLRMAAALGWFWYTHGHAAEGAARLERALAAAGGTPPPLLRGRATHVRGVLLSQRDELDAAAACFRAGSSCSGRRATSTVRPARSTASAATARNRCRFDEARGLFEQAVALRRAIGDRKELADPLSNLGIVAMDEGDLAGAGGLLRESLAIDREHGNEWGVAVNVANLGALALDEGRLGEAEELLGEALRALRPLGDRWSLLQALTPVRGAEEFAAAWEEGAGLPLERALDDAGA